MSCFFVRFAKFRFIVCFSCHSETKVSAPDFWAHNWSWVAVSITVNRHKHGRLWAGEIVIEQKGTTRWALLDRQFCRFQSNRTNSATLLSSSLFLVCSPLIFSQHSLYCPNEGFPVFGNVLTKKIDNRVDIYIEATMLVFIIGLRTQFLLSLILLSIVTNRILKVDHGKYSKLQVVQIHGCCSSVHRCWFSLFISKKILAERLKLETQYFPLTFKVHSFHFFSRN